MDKEEQLFRKRIMELASLSCERDIPIHTDFLNLNEQTIFHSLVNQFPDVRYRTVGGYEMAERKIVCFLPSYAQDEGVEIPLSYVGVEPVNAKFAESLTHRDYLGAIMNLGIERDKVGDILIEDGHCIVVCMEELAAYIAKGLSVIRHTSVKASVRTAMEMVVTPKYEKVEGSVTSARLDCILALAYRCSRSKATPLIEGERVFVNGKLATSNSLALKEGDVVSARGLGKFRYMGAQTTTKKGRLFVTLDKYC